MLNLPNAARSFSTTEARTGRDSPRSVPGGENQELASILLYPAPTSTLSAALQVRYILAVGLRWPKSS